MRKSRVCVWSIVAAFMATLPGQAARAQVGYDRPGGDYASYVLRSADPAQCASRCERDARCRSWAFSYPATENVNAMCWLKSRVPARTETTSVVSGVRGAGVIEPKSGPLEFAVDRIGGDYRHFDIPPDPTGKSCQLACEAEEGCRAWTYQRAGYGTAAPACFLKNRLTRPLRKPCCISGVVR